MRLRVLSAIVLAIPALLAVYVGFPVFDVVFALASLVMVLEWDRLCAPAERRDGVTWIFGASVLFPVLMSVADRPDWALGAVLAGSAVHYGAARVLRRPMPLLAASGTVYIGLPLVALLWLRHDAVYGMVSIFWLFAVVWATDTGALFSGRAIGGPKLAPSISPNKTWSGFFGGVVAAVAVSLIAGLWFGVSSLFPMAVLGALLSVTSQLGDLLESAVKRSLKVKDSGDIIPGHGGIFDRVDGLLLAAPMLAGLYLMAGGGGAQLWR